jgi:hypothetical protein
MSTAILCMLSFAAGAVVTVLIAALVSHLGDPDDDSEVNGPEFL